MARPQAGGGFDPVKFRTFVREHYLREAFAVAAEHDDA
jgi:hypothetical protein